MTQIIFKQNNFYSLYDSEQALMEHLKSLYKDITVYEEEGIVFFNHGEIRTHGHIIKPVIVKTNDNENTDIGDPDALCNY